MSRGEKLFKFLASLILRELYGTLMIRLGSGNVTHVESETRRMWQYRDLPADCAQDGTHVKRDT